MLRSHLFLTTMAGLALAGTPARAQQPTDANPDTSATTTTSTSEATGPEPIAPDGAPGPATTAEIERALAADATPPEPDHEHTDDLAHPAGGIATASGSSSTVFNPDISLILDFAFAGFSDHDHLQTGGHDPANPGFNLQQLELSLGKPVDPYFRFDANIVYGDHGFEVEEVYGTTLALPARLQLRAGQFLTRVGRLNPTHPHAWDFVDQPFALGRIFGGEGNRGLGTELSWLAPLPWSVEVIAAATTADGADTARSFWGAGPPDPDPGVTPDGHDDHGALAVNEPGDLQLSARVEQFFELGVDWSLLFGISGATGPNPTGPDARTHVAGGDLFLKYRPLHGGRFTQIAWQTEWYLRRRDDAGRTLQDASGYTQLVWRFARRFAIGGRFEHGSAPEDMDGTTTADDLDPAWTDARRRSAAVFTFYPTEFSRLRLEGSLDEPTWRDDPIWAGFIALQLVAGAHGAHPF